MKTENIIHFRASLAFLAWRGYARVSGDQIDRQSFYPTNSGCPHLIIAMLSHSITVDTVSKNNKLRQSLNIYRSNGVTSINVQSNI